MPQVNDQPDTALARVLLERGALDVATLRGCLDEVRRIRERRPDVTLALLLRDRRLVPADAIDEAVGAAKTMSVVELDPTLHEAHSPIPVPGVAPRPEQPRVLLHDTLQEPCAPIPLPGGHPPARPAAPTRIGDYEVERELARGGMGIVYVARHVRLDRRVALKVLRSGVGADAEEIERFLIEGRAAARLRHPNVVSVHEVDRDGPTWFLAMDLIDGESLRTRVLRDGPLSPAIAARITACVARALHEAHGKSVLHRDVKPHNVIVAHDGTPFLTDFGLAKVVDAAAAQGVTVSGQVMGTPAYMPPEQARGDSARVDRRADVYSLGATLYELLTGRPPFEGNSPLNIIRAVVEDEPVPPSRRRREVAPDLEAIVLKTLEKEPAARYDTAAELADDLERFVRHEPTRARPLDIVGRFVKWAHRNPLVVWTAAASAALLVAGIGVAGAVQIHRATERARDAEKLAADAEARVRDARRAHAEAATGVGTAPVGSRVAAARKVLDAATAWLTLAPDDAAARRARYEAALALGHAERRARRWSAASAAFEAARGLGDDEGDDEPIDRAVAWCRAMDGALEAWTATDPPRALREVDAAVELQPGWVEGWRLRGRLYGIDDARARASLDRAIALEPDDLESLNMRASLRLDRGDPGGAAEDARAALRVDRRSAPAWSTLALALLDSDGAKALAVMDEAVTMCPDDAGTWTLRASLRNAVGDAAGAVTDATEALALVPDEPRHLFTRASALTLLGRYEEAARDLERVCDVDPEHAELPAREVELLSARGDLRGALERADEAVARAPNDARRWFERGTCRHRLKDFAGAVDDYGVAARLAPGRAVHWTALGTAYLSAGDAVRAAGAAERALQLDAGQDHALFIRGVARLDLGDAGGAADLQEFLRRAPEHPDAGVARARLARGPGNPRR